MQVEQVTCAFCASSVAPEAGVRGRHAFACGACVAKALAAAIDRAGPGQELPEADVPCSFCGKPAPSASRVDGLEGTSICTSCLKRGFAFLTDTHGLTRRRKAWRDLGERALGEIVTDHLGSAGPDDVVTSFRTFPEYFRVDLNAALRARLAGARCVGVHQQYSHATLTFATLLERDGRVFVAPLQHDEFDVGADEPARCLVTGLWLVDAPAPHIVLLSPEHQFGRPQGWRVEVAVQPGERGEAVARSVFVDLEEAAAQTATYRGKVLSLERERHERKTGASVTVHRLAPVARQDVVLPAETLALLERNVFGFVAQRAALKAMGLPVKKGLLFHGPPGTGKTHTIRYLAGALPGHTTLLVTAEQVGHIDQYMTLGRLLSPAIVVIEDADLIARQREEMATPGQEVLLNQLLNEMDGLRDDAEILFILTTNRPEALEAALTDRPGRIDQAIAFPLPDAEGRRKLARLYGRGAPIPADALEHVVGRTEGVSAAFIRELMRRAAQYALERGAQDVEIAVADVDAALNELLLQGGRLNAALLGAVPPE